MLLSPFTGGFDGALVGFRARVAEEDLLHARPFAQRLGKRGSMLERVKLRSDRRRPLLVLVAEDVDAYAGGEVEITLSFRVIDRPALSPHQPHGKARVGGGDILLVLFLESHMFSPDTNIVPMPSSVSVSMRMECGTLPSMMNTFFTPRRIASMQQLTLGIIPPESCP